MSSKCYAENKMAVLNLRLNCEDKVSSGKIKGRYCKYREEQRKGMVEMGGRELGDEVGEGSLEHLMEGLWGGLLNGKRVWPLSQEETTGEF